MPALYVMACHQDKPCRRKPRYDDGFLQVHRAFAGNINVWQLLSVTQEPLAKVFNPAELSL